MKIRVERDGLADAVAWVARSLPARPPVPVLGGVLLDASSGEALTVSGFDYEVSAQVTVDATVDSDGRALVSGRLLADITKALPARPVELTVDGTRMTITCGSSRFSLPTMPVEDYPSLPEMPAHAGSIPGDLFTEAVGQVATAAGKDDTLPMLTGIRMEINSDRVTMVATDRFRLAMREFSWEPGESMDDTAVLIPAKTLADSAKTLGGGGNKVEVSLASGAGLLRQPGAGASPRSLRLLQAGRGPGRGHSTSAHAALAAADRFRPATCSHCRGRNRPWRGFETGVGQAAKPLPPRMPPAPRWVLGRGPREEGSHVAYWHT